MNYFCKGMCVFHKSKTRGSGHKIYVGFKKWCRPCHIFIWWEGLRCPCCGSKLRTRPEEKKNRLKYYEEKLLRMMIPKMEEPILSVQE